MKTIPWILFAMVIASCGSKRGGDTGMPVIEGNTMDVSFRSGRGELPLFVHDGAFYLLGEEGREYRICLRNQAPVRAEAVISVDGRDVVSGRSADYRTDRGYVLEPREEICVEGFRESTESVAAFTFASPEDSYAAKMGDGSNVGVIGIAVFDEVEGAGRPAVIAGEPGPDYRGYNDYDEAPAAEAYPAQAAKEESASGIGTAYGQSVSSRAEVVPFVRRDAERPTELVTVYYDDRDGLKARGIRVSKDMEIVNRTPTPFPGVEGSGEFAPPPPR